MVQIYNEVSMHSSFVAINKVFQVTYDLFSYTRQQQTGGGTPIVKC